MDDLGPEVRQLHRFVVRERVDDLGIGHAARIGRQHAIDVGPDMNLRGIEQRTEDRGREIAAVAPERGLHAARIGGNEAGDHQRLRRIAADQLIELRARLLPLDGRAERPPLHHDAAARIDPLHALAHTTLPQITVEQTRRPYFAKAGRQIGHALRGRSHHARGLQDARKISAVAVELGQVLGRRGRIEQRGGDVGMTRSQGRQARPPALITPFGQRNQLQQLVGYPLAGRQHHGHSRARVERRRLEDARHALEAVRIGDARAAKLVHHPGFGIGNVGAAIGCAHWIYCGHKTSALY